MSRLRWRDWILLVLACTLGMLVVARLSTGLPGLVPACLFHRFTGLHCPGCGGTRCMLRLSHGDLPGAVAMNPLVILYLAGLIGWLGLGSYLEFRGRAVPALPGWTGWLLGGGVLLFGILRNLPWWPFTLLAPHA